MTSRTLVGTSVVAYEKLLPGTCCKLGTMDRTPERNSAVLVSPLLVPKPTSVFEQVVLPSSLLNKAFAHPTIAGNSGCFTCGAFLSN